MLSRLLVGSQAKIKAGIGLANKATGRVAPR
jgi:hypothetical protein